MECERALESKANPYTFCKTGSKLNLVNKIIPFFSLSLLVPLKTLCVLVTINEFQSFYNFLSAYFNTSTNKSSNKFTGYWFSIMQ